MRIAFLMAAGLFLLAALVQWNDPDPALWMAVYGSVAVLSAAAAGGRTFPFATIALVVIYAIAGALQLPTASVASVDLSNFGMSSLGVEEMREALGLWLCAFWLLVVAVAGRVSARAVAAVLTLVWLAPGCAALTASQSSSRASEGGIEVPHEAPRHSLPRTRVATDLANPRGMLLRDEGELLVSIAGTGDGTPDGALLVLSDPDGDGTYQHRRVLLGAQESRNIVDIVRRDEVFGMAGIAEGGGATMVSLAYFGGPSTIFSVEGNTVEPWSRVHGNINDLAYDPGRDAWVGVSSSSDEVVRLQPGRGSERIVKIPPLAGGQDPVPGYLRHDPTTGDLLVSLFSGSTAGEEGGRGVELVPRAGGIVRVDPDTGAFEWVVTGLTAPTDLEIGPDGRLYVLEFCSAFEEPVESREQFGEDARHGGFRRFSGRLLAIDRESGQVEVLAERLDGPTNLALSGRDLYIAQGMGTPGRPIPGPGGEVPLTGFVERVELPEAGRST